MMKKEVNSALHDHHDLIEFITDHQSQNKKTYELKLYMYIQVFFKLTSSFYDIQYRVYLIFVLK